MNADITGLVDLSSLVAQSVKYRSKAMSLNGTDVVCVDGEGKQRLSLGDMKGNCDEKQRFNTYLTDPLNRFSYDL